MGRSAAERPSRAGTPPHSPLLAAQGLRKHFALRRSLPWRPRVMVKAVDDVSFDVLEGEVLGVVGESGCGKTTVARLLMLLLERDRGEIELDGRAVGASGGIPIREFRRQVQMVFQNSYSSLNPRLPVEETLAFGPRVHGVGRREASARASELLTRVGLDPAVFMRRYAHELSGGQRQRVNIARALVLRPRLLLLDEAVSALDKSVQAQVLNLLLDLKDDFGLTYLFISHDLDVVRYLSDRVMVMYLGKVVEMGSAEAIYRAPRHPYTQALLAARPSMDPARRTHEAPLTGDPPSPVDPPSGCRFRTRCPFAEPVCGSSEPRLASGPGTPGHSAACHMTVPGSGHSAARAP